MHTGGERAPALEATSARRVVGSTWSGSWGTHTPVSGQLPSGRGEMSYPSPAVHSAKFCQAPLAGGGRGKPPVQNHR